MKTRSKWLVGVLLTSLTAVIGVAVVGYSVARPTYAAHRVNFSNIDLFNSDQALATQDWTPDLVGSDPGAVEKQWLSGSGTLLYLELREYQNEIVSRYQFYSLDPSDRYIRRYGRNLVKFVNKPAGLHSSQSKIFCGNTGRSLDVSFSQCSIWGAWLRYGQYLIYVEIFDLKIKVSDFFPVVTSLDSQVMASLQG